MENEENVTTMITQKCPLPKRRLLCIPPYIVEGLVIISLAMSSNFPVEFVCKSLPNMLDKLWLCILFNNTL